MPRNPDEEKLLEAFERFQQALIENDVNELDRLLAPDYRGYNLQGGLEDRGLILEAWKPGGVSMDEFSFENLRIDVRGDVGILTGNGFVAGAYQGEPWEHHLHFCDLYLKTPDGWQIFVSHAVEVEPAEPAPKTDDIQPGPEG